MNTDTKILRKISNYQPKGGLGHTAELILSLSVVNHTQVKKHLERVALLSEETARRQKKDNKAAFFAGLLHDVGKILLPYKLFDGHNINSEEYGEVKRHAIAAYMAMEDRHLFTALCAGLHHNLYKKGYGLKMGDFPTDLSPATIKKVLDIAMIISICDFVDAFTHRDTKILDGSDKKSPKLKKMLQEKYPNEFQTIEIVLQVNKDLCL